MWNKGVFKGFPLTSHEGSRTADQNGTEEFSRGYKPSRRGEFPPGFPRDYEGKYATHIMFNGAAQTCDLFVLGARVYLIRQYYDHVFPTVARVVKRHCLSVGRRRARSHYSKKKKIPRSKQPVKTTHTFLLAILFFFFFSRKNGVYVCSAVADKFPNDYCHKSSLILLLLRQYQRKTPLWQLSDW